MVGTMFREIKILATNQIKKVVMIGWNDIFILCF